MDTWKRHLQPEQCKSVSAFALRKTSEVRTIYSSIAFVLRYGKDNESLLFVPQVLPTFAK